jgi:hypothetical protein
MTPSQFDFKPGDDGIVAAVVMGLWAADLCASSVADTLTLPLFVYWERKREREEKKDADREETRNVPAQDAVGNEVNGSSAGVENRGGSAEANREEGRRAPWLPREDPFWLHPPGAAPSPFPALPHSGIRSFPD